MSKGKRELGRGRLVWLLVVIASFVACAGKRAPSVPATTVQRASPAAPLARTPETAAPIIPSEEIATVPVSTRDPQWGAHDALVTVVVFSDFQCPFCARVEPTLKMIRDTYGPLKLRIVWKNNPLPFHQNARPAAEAGMAVFGLKGSNAFWAFHDRAFGNQTDLSADNYRKWATEAGVSAAEFDEALASKRFSGKIEQDIALAAKVGANGTPAFRINGVSVSGAQPFDKFREVIDASLVEAGTALLDGTPPSEVYATLTNKHQSAEAAAQPPSKQADDDEDLNVWKVPVAADDPTRGAKDALVTIVVFSDLQCPFCKRVEPTLKKLAESYGPDLRIVWKDNPLPFHLRARAAAYLARYAYAQKGNDAFWSAHDQLLDSNPKLEDEDLERIAEQLGLNWAAAKAASNRGVFAPKIDASIDLASELQARGTPHFFINGRRLSGAQPYASFAKLVDEQLALAKGRVASGIPRAKVYEAIIQNGKEPPPPERKAVPAPDASNPVRGAATAKVVIEEFADFQCPFCKRVEPTLHALQQKYGAKIKFVWRHLPLPFHKNAQLAAEAAQEVYSQQGSAGFWAFHDKLFNSDKDDSTRTDRATLEQFASELGVNMNEFQTALDSHKHQAKVEADTALANKIGINGTPAFVINGYYLSGAQPEAAFRKLIELSLKGAPPAR